MLVLIISSYIAGPSLLVFAASFGLCLLLVLLLLFLLSIVLHIGLYTRGHDHSTTPRCIRNQGCTLSTFGSFRKSLKILFFFFLRIFQIFVYSLFYFYFIFMSYRLLKYLVYVYLDFHVSLQWTMYLRNWQARKKKRKNKILMKIILILVKARKKQI